MDDKKTFIKRQDCTKENYDATIEAMTKAAATGELTEEAFLLYYFFCMSQFLEYDAEKDGFWFSIPE